MRPTGAKALTMKQAIVIAAVCEFGGAVLLVRACCASRPLGMLAVLPAQAALHKTAFSKPDIHTLFAGYIVLHPAGSGSDEHHSKQHCQPERFQGEDSSEAGGAQRGHSWRSCRQRPLSCCTPPNHRF